MMFQAIKSEVVSHISYIVGSKAQAYELRIKAYLATFLDSVSMQEILDKVTDQQAAQILLVFLNIFAQEKD